MVFLGFTRLFYRVYIGFRSLGFRGLGFRAPYFYGISVSGSPSAETLESPS